MTVILRNELYIITIDERYIDGRWVSPEERMSYFQLSTMFYVISMPDYIIRLLNFGTAHYCLLPH